MPSQNTCGSLAPLPVQGYRAHETIDVVKRKLSDPSIIGPKVGLLIEGGALRGVVSCGYAKAIGDVVGTSIFSGLFGSSSGALNAVYLASGSMDVALSIYIEDATDVRCTNKFRFPNVLNVRWLIAERLFGTKQFSISTLRKQGCPVFASVTNATTGEPRYFDTTTLDDQTLRSVLHATACAPLLTNELVEIERQLYTDGAASDSILYDFAVRQGCTHLVCLLTRPPEYRKSHTLSSDLFERTRLLHRPKAFRDAYTHRSRQYNKILDRAYFGDEAAVPTWIIAPDSDEDIPGNIEVRPDVIRVKGQNAYSKSRALLQNILTQPNSAC